MSSATQSPAHRKTLHHIGEQSRPRGRSRRPEASRANGSASIRGFHHHYLVASQPQGFNGVVGLTDWDWYSFLRDRDDLDEVNFWRPSAMGFKALKATEPFFFKLKAPRQEIAGFGVFSRVVRLPVWQAWEVFEERNGTASRTELLERLRKYSGPRKEVGLNSEITCIVIQQPLFFQRADDWVAPPEDWSKNIVAYKQYPLWEGEGKRAWRDCLDMAARLSAPQAIWDGEAKEAERFGKPYLVTPRKGQAGFALSVLEAYGVQCAVTTEHSRPALEAAHIRPYAEGGSHEVSNGMPLRRDIHALFDAGYVTVTPSREFMVSGRLRDDFANGKVYYELAGRKIVTPDSPDNAPDPELLEWHGDVKFLG